MSAIYNRLFMKVKKMKCTLKYFNRPTNGHRVGICVGAGGGRFDISGSWTVIGQILEELYLKCVHHCLQHN